MFLKLSTLPPWVCWRRRRKGGGGGGGVKHASCLVAKQAVEFPQVLASTFYTVLTDFIQTCTLSNTMQWITHQMLQCKWKIPAQFPIEWCNELRFHCSYVRCLLARALKRKLKSHNLGPIFTQGMSRKKPKTSLWTKVFTSSTASL